MTTNTASGAAIQRYKIGYHSDEWGQRSSTPGGIPDASGPWVRYADHVTALAGQAKAAQPDLITIRKPTTRAEMMWLLKLAHLVISDVNKTLDDAFAPAQPSAVESNTAYAELPEPESYGTRNGRIDPKQPLFTEDDMRDHADRTHVLRAEALAAAYRKELDKMSQRNYELRFASHGQALRLLTQKEKDSLGRRAEGMDGNEWDQWVQEKFAQVNGLRVQGGSYE